jgi:hypothetical protein
MMVQNQYRPVFATALHLPLNLLPCLQPRYCFLASVRVGPGVDGIFQYAEDGVVSGQGNRIWNFDEPAVILPE